MTTRGLIRQILVVMEEQLCIVACEGGYSNLCVDKSARPMTVPPSLL